MIEVTPTQYDNLTNARGNWPKKLSYDAGSDEEGKPGCTLVYLARNAGLMPREVVDNYFLEGDTGLTEEAELVIEEHYGLDLGTQMGLAQSNDAISYRFHEEKRRAGEMAIEFRNLMDTQVEVIESEFDSETYLGNPIEMTSKKRLEARV